MGRLNSAFEVQHTAALSPEKKHAARLVQGQRQNISLGQVIKSVERCPLVGRHVTARLNMARKSKKSGLPIENGD